MYFFDIVIASSYIFYLSFLMHWTLHLELCYKLISILCKLDELCYFMDVL